MKELFSRRYRDKSGDPEVYIYNEFSEAFRNQCFHIISTFIECIENKRYEVPFTKIICESYSREAGLKCLHGNYGYINNIDAIENYIDDSTNEDFLDLLDFVFSNIVCNTSLQAEMRVYFQFETNPFQEAIDELNLRFRQHSLGYECANGEIIPKTNAILHQTTIKPALKLLTDERFRGAEEEYLNAFEHLKAGNNKDAILNAGKAFESTIKVICNNLGYSYQKTDAAKALVEVLKNNQFFPPYLTSSLNHLCSLIEEGAPVVRNKESGHGQGSNVKSTTNEYVEFVLNTVASNIVLFYRIFESRAKNDTTNQTTY